MTPVHSHETPAGGMRLRRLFEAALEVPDDARAAWLDRHAADAGERAALQRLLAADAGVDGALDLPVTERAARLGTCAGSDADAAVTGMVGQRIGQFRLVRLLGQGGMATVFLAEREGADFAQQVAVKLLRRGLYSDVEQRLFRRERRTLSLLSHPNIARLVDGGVTAAGIPFLVMECVDGVPITRHAFEQRLDLRARLRLFVVVCGAVAAAHRQLIVHRDIKPSNILVTAEGEVKLLDFGIAKLLDEDDGATIAGAAALTPGYAAPEQYAGGPVSTATDVYALGVLLHELLLCRRPDGDASRRPSCLAYDTGVDPAHLPLPRAALHHALRGDLDNILLRALAPEPARRYPSAGALADDISRHLDALPVAAHPPSPGYRARKFVRRHRSAVTLAVVFALGLLASTGAALWQAREARLQAQAAEEQTQRAVAVRDLLVQLFENEQPGMARSALPDTATLLRRAAERSRDGMHHAPAVRVDMLVVIGRIHDRLSQYAQARSLLTEAVDAARQLPAKQHATLGTALSQLGQLELSLKHHAAALRLFEEALAIQQAREPHGLDTAMTLHRRALAYSETARHAQALADYRAALALRTARLPAEHELLVASYGALGTAYSRAHRLQEAEHWQRRALAMARRIHGNVHEETARRLSNLGVTLFDLGQHAEAGRLFDEAVAIDRRVFSAPNAGAAPRLHNLGTLQLRLGQLDQGERSLRAALALGDVLGLGQAPGHGYTLHQLARLQELRGDREQALATARQATQVLSATLPEGHARRIEAELQLARLMLPNAADIPADAPPDAVATVQAIHARVERLLQRVPVDDVPLQASARHLLGLALAAGSDWAVAERELVAATSGLHGPAGLRHDAAGWFATLARVRLQRGDTDGARQALHAGLALAERMHLPPRHYLRAQLLLTLAELEHGARRSAEARRHAGAALQAMDGWLPGRHPWRKQARRLL
ncbi:tetratricopeptide repeat protein [Luteimonas sp. A482]